MNGWADMTLFLVYQATNEVVSRVPKCTHEEMAEAVAAAQHAYKEWKDTTPLTRQRKMLDLQLLIRDNSVLFYRLFFLVSSLTQTPALKGKNRRVHHR